MNKAIVFEALNYSQTLNFFKLLNVSQVNIYFNKDIRENNNTLEEGLEYLHQKTIRKDNPDLAESKYSYSELISKQNNDVNIYKEKVTDKYGIRYMRFPFSIVSTQTRPYILQYLNDYSNVYSFLKNDSFFVNKDNEKETFSNLSNILEDIYNSYTDDVITTYVISFKNNSIHLDIHLGLPFKYTFKFFLEDFYLNKNINLLELPLEKDIKNIPEDEFIEFITPYFNIIEDFQIINSSYKAMFKSIYFLLNNNYNQNLFKPIPNIFQLKN